MLAEEKIQSGKLQGIVELAGTVAHEINSPLFAALGTAQLLADGSKQPDVVDELEIIIRNLQQISELTKKMTSMTGFTSREYVGASKLLLFTEENR
jgi:two-component system NtrC family sensor kinase